MVHRPLRGQHCSLRSGPGNGYYTIWYIKGSDGLNFWWYSPCESSVEMVEIIGQPVR